MIYYNRRLKQDINYDYQCYCFGCVFLCVCGEYGLHVFEKLCSEIVGRNAGEKCGFVEWDEDYLIKFCLRNWMLMNSHYQCEPKIGNSGWQINKIKNLCFFFSSFFFF
jgi:hypothetical protein